MSDDEGGCVVVALLCIGAWIAFAVVVSLALLAVWRATESVWRMIG